jgi:hypothetical protein
MANAGDVVLTNKRRRPRKGGVFFFGNRARIERYEVGTVAIVWRIRLAIL